MDDSSGTFDLEKRLAEISLKKASPRSSTTLDERKLLIFLAQQYTGKGEICDVGCGNGGTTHALCTGLERNTTEDLSKKKRIHAFDWFEFGAGVHGAAANYDKFVDNLQGFEDLYNVYSGNLLKMEWHRGPIEILFVDVAKELVLHKKVVELFFRYLEPNVSYLIHQDFGRPRLPWLHYSTAYILPYIEIRGIVSDSLVAFFRKRIPESVLSKLIEDDFTLAEKLSLINKIEESIPEEVTGKVNYNNIMKLSRAFLFFYHGNKREARKIVAEIADREFLKSFERMIVPIVRS